MWFSSSGPVLDECQISYWSGSCPMPHPRMMASKRRFEAIILGWGIGQDPDQYEIWHSSKTGPDELNHISFANAEVDELLEKGRASCHQEARVRYYHRLQEILAEEQPIVFLYFRDALPVVSSRVRGIVPAPNGIRYNFPTWYVPTHLQRYTAG